MERTYPHRVKYGGKYYAPGEPVEVHVSMGSQEEEALKTKKKPPEKRWRKAAGA